MGHIIYVSEFPLARGRALATTSSIHGLMKRNPPRTSCVCICVIIPGTYLVILVLQLGLGALAAGADGLGVVAVEGAAGLGVVEGGAVLVVAGDEQGDAEGPAHDALLAVGALAEPQRQVADGLRAALHPQVLAVVEPVALALHARVLHHAARVRLQPAHRAPDVPVDLHDLLDRGRLEERRRHALLHAEHDALRGRHPDRRRAQLDRFEGVLDLEEAAFGRERAVGGGV